jgi:hypothetical protein
MKKTCTFLAMILFMANSFAQTVEVLHQYGTGWGGGVEVDINNNGHLDLLFGGIAKPTVPPRTVEDPNGNQVESDKITILLMYNPTSKSYEAKPTNILNADRAHYIVADFNGDGIMDLVLAEHARDVLYKPGIFEGVGDGTFTYKEMTFDTEGFVFRPVSVAVADFNNDARPDIVALGYERINDVVVHRSAVLINKGNYEFAVTNTELLHDYELALVTVKVLDHNNDGYMDFFVSGNVDNKASNNGARVIADIFENLGADEPGSFYRLFMGDGMIFQKANGGLDIADFNNDGWLDFALHGEGGEGTGEPTSGDIWASISRVYINQKNGTYTAKAQTTFSADLRPLNSSGTSTRAFDWNGNGSSDLFIPGWNPAPETATQAGFYWINDGTATFGQKVRVPGASEVFILFPDWNGDGIRDYFMSGQSWDKQYFSEEVEGRTAAVMLNNRTVINERPSAPSGLAAAVDQSSVTLSWNAATDKETPAAGLSYEYFLKKDGTLYNSVRSHVGGNLDGVRKVLDLGNAMLNKSITLHTLPDGNYEWGVQAIDASYEGSTFATGTFIIGGTNVENPLKNQVKIYTEYNTLSVRSNTPGTIHIFSITGALIRTVENTVSLNANLPTGLYIVRVIVDNEPVVRKVVIR